MSDQPYRTAPLTVAVIAAGENMDTWRWLTAARDPGLRLILVPATRAALAAAERGIPVAHRDHLARLSADDLAVWIGSFYETEPDPVDNLPAPLGWPDRRSLVQGAGIVRAIRAIQPALVHALDTHVAGYPCLAAARLCPGEMPPWLQSGVASDLRAYGSLAEHRPVLAELLSTADAFLGESESDLVEARNLGYAGRALSPIPPGGTIDIDEPLQDLPSQRTRILVNGAHGWPSRGLDVLSALHLARHALANHCIGVFNASAPVRRAVELLRDRSGLDIVVDENIDATSESLVAHATRARVVVDLGTSRTRTLIDTMTAGAFPVRSAESSAREWIRGGEDGFVVSSDDTDALAEAIVMAMRDDALVDHAAPRNRAEVVRRTANAGEAIRDRYFAAIDCAKREDQKQAV